MLLFPVPVVLPRAGHVVHILTNKNQVKAPRGGGVKAGMYGETRGKS